MVNRRSVWLAALDPTGDGEIQKTRPCVIVSPDEMNAHLPTILVAPMTSGSRPARFHVRVRFRRKDGLILPDQIRTVDRERLIALLGKIDAVTIRALLDILAEMFRT